MRLLLQQSRLWWHPMIMLNIFRHVFVQDPLPIFFNAPLFFYKTHGKIVAYCTLSKHSNYQQLKDVFTFQIHRKKGHASSLIQDVLGYYQCPTYLICKPDLAPFYQRVGFRIVRSFPFRVRMRFWVGDFFTRLFYDRHHVVMRYPSI